MKIIKQRDIMDCGVCALLSIIKFYGGNVSLEQLRLDAKVSKDGTSALNLINAAKHYGFDASGIRLKDLDEIDVLPAIAHMNMKKGYTHYVVIYKITKDKVIVMDPAKGKVVIDKNIFVSEWSNVVLLFYPNSKITVLKQSNNLFNAFSKILFHEKRLVMFIVFVSLLLTLFTIVGGYYFQVMSGLIQSGFEKNILKYFVLTFGAFLIGKLALSYIRNYLENHLNKNIDCLLNKEFLSHLYNVPLEVINSRTSGEIVTRVGELANVKSLVCNILIASCLDFFLLIAVVPILYGISSKLFLILFLSLLLYFMIGFLSSRKVYKMVYQNIEYEADFNDCLIEDMKMMGSIKNLDVVNLRLLHLDRVVSKYFYDGFLLNGYLNRVGSIKNIVEELCFFLINTYGFYQVINGSLDIVSIVTFNTFVGFFFNPLKNVVDSFPQYNYLKATFNKINDFLGVDIEALGNLDSLDDFSISVGDVSYSYNKFEDVIKNVSFNINSGEFVSLTGPSGCGKSTICKIFDKYITDYEGNINIGGINMKDLSLATIRENIRYVNQSEALFTGTIRENILIGQEVDEKKFRHICKICGVDKIVGSKPLRYETMIGFDKSLSGGEQQRVILARSLLKDFNILILDEALSEVDLALERKIMNNIRAEFGDKTIIYITHKNHENLFDRVINIGGNNELSKVN